MASTHHLENLIKSHDSYNSATFTKEEKLNGAEQSQYAKKKKGLFALTFSATKQGKIFTRIAGKQDEKENVPEDMEAIAHSKLELERIEA